MLNVRPYTPALQKLAAKFDCGNSYLNQFLRSPDALDAGVGKTFVFLTENAESIVGYYNLSCGSLDEIEGDVRYKIGGTIHIGYFAIDEKFQHQLQATTPNGIHLYWGDVLLEECLSRIEAIRSQQVGVSFVTLASSEAGERLYRHHDFEDLDADITFSLLTGRINASVSISRWIIDPHDQSRARRGAALFWYNPAPLCPHWQYLMAERELCMGRADVLFSV